MNEKTGEVIEEKERSLKGIRKKRTSK